MTIALECPQCIRRLKTRDEMAGRCLKCPNCGTAIPVPQPSATLEIRPESVMSTCESALKRRGLPPASQPHSLPSSGVVRTAESMEPQERPRRNSVKQTADHAGQVISAIAGSSESPLSSPESFRSKASVVIRALGYVIDLLPTFLAIPFFLIPILGQIVAGALLCAYWLLRDINGASLGKLALGCRVATIRNGEDSLPKHRIFRNLTLAMIPLSLTIPFIGFFLVLIVGPIIIGTEAICLLAIGKRIGDMIAGTTIVTNSNP